MDNAADPFQDEDRPLLASYRLSGDFTPPSFHVSINSVDYSSFTPRKMGALMRRKKLTPMLRLAGLKPGRT